MNDDSRLAEAYKTIMAAFAVWLSEEGDGFQGKKDSLIKFLTVVRDCRLWYGDPNIQKPKGL